MFKSVTSKAYMYDSNHDHQEVQHKIYKNKFVIFYVIYVLYLVSKYFLYVKF